MATRSLFSVLFLLAGGIGAGPVDAGEAGSLLVRVVNERGQPVAEARVQAGLEPEEFGGPNREIRQETTAADGTVRLTGLSSDELVWLLIERKGFVPDLRNVKLRAGEQREMRVVLRPGGVAVGRVVDEAGRPVAGVEVDVWGDVFGLPLDELPAFLRDKAWQRTRTGPAGRFRFPDLPEGSFELALQHPSYVPFQAVQPIQGGHGGDLGRFVLRGGARLTGTVSDPDGRPIADLPLWAVTRWTQEDEEVPPSAITGPDGTFEILHLPSGEIHLHACGQGYVQQSVPVRFPDEPVHLTLLPAATLSGRVLRPDGQPLEGAEVFAFQRNTFDPGNPEPWTPCPEGQWATSDAAGRFMAGPLPPGRYELRVRTDDLLLGGVSNVPAAAGETVEGIEIRLVSERAGALAGRVLDMAGAPIAGALVSASTQTSNESIVSAADGSYRFDSVGRGRLTLLAEAFGYDSLQRITELSSAETRIDLVLARDQSCACTPVPVRGRVVGPEGTPVEGAVIVTGSGAKTWTTADGSFELRSPPPLHLSVSKPGFAFHWFEVDAAQAEGLELRLDRGTAIAGRLLGLTAEERDARPFATLSCGEDSLSAYLRADGTFRFEHVLPGSCSLMACAGERCAEAELVLEPGQGEIAVTLELAETYPDSGH